MDVKAIYDRARWLLKDSQGSWATDDFLLEGINHVYDTAFLELENINFPFDEVVVELLAVTANTVNLNTYDAAQATPVLKFMVTPLQVEWKIAGRPVTEYLDVDKVDKLPDIGTGTSAASVISDTQAVIAYEFRGMNIFITPASVAVDLRLRIKQLFAQLQSSDGTLAINSIRPFLGARLAQYVAAIRENFDMVKWLQGEGDNVLALINANFVKSDQGKMRRIGSPTLQRRIFQRRTGRYPNLRS